MSDWLTYAPADFLIFSPEVYWRLFVLQNAALWPMPVLAPLVLLAGLVAGLRGPGWEMRAFAGLLALVWLWVGWSFVWQRYAPINLAAGYVAAGFLLQAFLWGWVAVRTTPNGDERQRTVRLPGLALCAAALVLYPLVGLLFDRPLGAAEVAGIAPDPTALFSVGAACAVLPRHVCLVLNIIPLTSLALSAGRLAVLEELHANLLAGVNVIALILIIMGNRTPRVG